MLKYFFKNFVKEINRYKDKSYNQLCLEKMTNGIFDDDIESYIYSLRNDNLCNQIIKYQKNNLYKKSFYEFMDKDFENSFFILNQIQKNIGLIWYKWEEYDALVSFTSFILLNSTFTFEIKRIAAEILHEVAWQIGSYNTQKILKKLLKRELIQVFKKYFKFNCSGTFFQTRIKVMFFTLWLF